ncbi:hypothetical protein J3F83DRAFT_731948 [Trichoderma novae-zelandiae]
MRSLFLFLFFLGLCVVTGQRGRQPSGHPGGWHPGCVLGVYIKSTGVIGSKIERGASYSTLTLHEDSSESQVQPCTGVYSLILSAYHLPMATSSPWSTRLVRMSIPTHIGFAANQGLAVGFNQISGKFDLREASSRTTNSVAPKPAVGKSKKEGFENRQTGPGK